MAGEDSSVVPGRCAFTNERALLPRQLAKDWAQINFYEINCFIHAI